jgi:hypothetical protein
LLSVFTEREPTLGSIRVDVLKETYAYGEAFDPAKGIVATGVYSDGSTQTLVITSAEVTGYDPAKPGSQNLLLSRDGKTAVFTVFVEAEVTLESINNVEVLRNYAYGEAFDPAGIVATGTYSDGSTKTLVITSDDVSGYEATKTGSQKLVLSLEGKTRVFTVYVETEPQAGTPSITISWPNDADKQPVIYGLPAKDKEGDPDFKLSWLGNNGLPKEIVISAGSGSQVYDDTGKWYIDNEEKHSGSNIITIKAGDYTLNIPHRVTFVGVKDEVEYSAAITFIVER